MKKNEVMNYAVMFFIFGLILRISPALDIIHELMHYGWCNVAGIEVLELHWSSIKYASVSSLVIYGGYGSEFILYAVLVLFASYRHKIIASFFMGILVVVFFVSFGSKDYNVYALDYYGDPAIVKRQLIMWGVWTSLAMVGIIKVYLTRRKR